MLVSNPLRGEWTQNLTSDYVNAVRIAILLMCMCVPQDGRHNENFISDSLNDLGRVGSIDATEESAASRTAINLATELDELRVIDALADRRWDFRTITGIAKETKLRPEFIESTLKKHSEKIRRSKVPNHNGEILFTLSSRPETLRERLALWLIFIKKSL